MRSQMPQSNWQEDYYMQKKKKFSSNDTPFQIWIKAVEYTVLVIYLFSAETAWNKNIWLSRLGKS